MVTNNTELGINGAVSKALIWMHVIWMKKIVNVL